MSKKILFLSTHNFATNPRLVKEIRLAIAKNFEVEVICFEFRNWSYEFNQAIKKEFVDAGVVLHVLEAGRKPFTHWFLSVTSELIARWKSNFVLVQDHDLANGVSRRNKLLLNSLEKIKHADWVIGHNPGALWATLKAAEKFYCKAGFDVEDYHPGEGSNIHVQSLTQRLMQRVLPKMDYISFAAPLIRKEVSKDLGGEGKEWITVLNYSTVSDFESPESIEGPLKLVWFSQNINWGRGLELVLPIMKKFRGKIELHLFGKINKEFSQKLINGIDNVIVHDPLPQMILHAHLKAFDIGLALEISLDENRGVCLTNKLLTYMQAGLYVLATKTPAQQDYLSQYKEHGTLFSLEILEATLDDLVAQKDEIRNNKLKRFENFENINWEKESEKLMNVWN